MRVLLAFDKFKDALSATAACDIVAKSLSRIRPAWTIDRCPLTDGGDGFEGILAHALKSDRVELTVTGPRGTPVAAGFSLCALQQFPESAQRDGFAGLELSATAKIAIVELARASGLALLDPTERNPWQTTTYGTGQLIRASAEMGAQAILLGIGGSATNDTGAGALAALGLEFWGTDGQIFVPPLPRHGTAIRQLRGAVHPALPPIVVATDVRNPLLGQRGAAATFAPQKGLPPGTLEDLEFWTRHMAALLCEHTGNSPALADQPGMGAAGGTAFGLACACRARIISGFELTATCLDLRRRIAEADLVLTGEGRYDVSSLDGKGPGRVVAAAQAAGKPVWIFAGQITVPSQPEVRLFPLNPRGPVDNEILACTAQTLDTTIQRAFATI